MSILVIDQRQMLALNMGMMDAILNGGPLPTSITEMEELAHGTMERYLEPQDTTDPKVVEIEKEGTSSPPSEASPPKEGKGKK